MEGVRGAVVEAGDVAHCGVGVVVELVRINKRARTDGSGRGSTGSSKQGTPRKVSTMALASAVRETRGIKTVTTVITMLPEGNRGRDQV